MQIVHLVGLPDAQAHAATKSNHDEVYHDAKNAGSLEELLYEYAVVFYWIENDLND